MQVGAIRWFHQNIRKKVTCTVCGQERLSQAVREEYDPMLSHNRIRILLGSIDCAVPTRKSTWSSAGCQREEGNMNKEMQMKRININREKYQVQAISFLKITTKHVNLSIVQTANYYIPKIKNHKKLRGVHIFFCGYVIAKISPAKLWYSKEPHHLQD